MNSPQAQDKFNRADALYREGHYEAALKVLHELEREYPGERNILYPLARCLSKLSRDTEALRICDELIEKYQHPKAKELRALIVTQETVISSFGHGDEIPSGGDPDATLETNRLPDSAQEENMSQELTPTVISKVLPGTKPDRRPLNPWVKTCVVSAIVMVSIVTGYVVLFG